MVDCCEDGFCVRFPEDVVLVTESMLDSDALMVSMIQRYVEVIRKPFLFFPLCTRSAAN